MKSAVPLPAAAADLLAASDGAVAFDDPPVRRAEIGAAMRFGENAMSDASLKVAEKPAAMGYEADWPDAIFESPSVGLSGDSRNAVAELSRRTAMLHAVGEAAKQIVAGAD